jgi:hypothetical protein
MENKSIALAGDLVETAGDSGSGFIDSSEHVETGDGSNIFSGLSLKAALVTVPPR